MHGKPYQAHRDVRLLTRIFCHQPFNPPQKDSHKSKDHYNRSRTLLPSIYVSTAIRVTIQTLRLTMTNDPRQLLNQSLFLALLCYSHPVQSLSDTYLNHLKAADVLGPCIVLDI